jgi:hypothetical protein
MSAFEPGEIVNVDFYNARYVGKRDGDLGFAMADDQQVWLPSLAIRVTRVAPKEWPPQPGDAWEDRHGSTWFAFRDRRGVVLMQSGDPTSDVKPSPETVLTNVGPLRLAYRKGWSPEAAPAVEPEPPAAQIDHRAEYVAGLREMADWLEANPAVPLDNGGQDHLSIVQRGSDDANRAELERIAALLGVEPDSTSAHPGVRRMFRGRIAYRAFYIPAPKPVEDLTRGGEVAAADGDAGAATATPDETDAEASPRLEEVAGPGSGQGKDGPATDEPVWVAVKRKGIDYHAYPGGAYTGCDRPTINGLMLKRSDAVTAGQRPCPRCYPHSPAGAGVS